MKSDNPWLEWAKELQFLSQCALTYCKDPYDTERFQRIREIAAEMAAALSDVPVEKVTGLFCNEKGYQTPKLDTRAAIIKEGKILLVQERDGLWAMPGGWCDYDQTIRRNTEKEALEESGMRVRAARLVAILEHNRRNLPPSPWEICSAFVLCDYIGGEFVPNVETVGCDWFTPEALPPLNPRKTSAEEVEMCFRAWADPHWQTLFD